MHGLKIARSSSILFSSTVGQPRYVLRVAWIRQQYPFPEEVQPFGGFDEAIHSSIMPAACKKSARFESHSIHLEDGS